jgi:hypothetical protein
MTNPYTFHSLQKVGLIPKEALLLDGNADNPLAIAYQEVVKESKNLQLENKTKGEIE